jgi:hypothetical protein
MIRLFFLLLLASCTNIPTTPDGPQCSPVFTYVKSTDGKEYIEVESSYCLCRMYHFGLDYVGKVPNITTWKEPIKYCDKLIGWTPEEYTKKASFWEAVRAAVEKEINNHE